VKNFLGDKLIDFAGWYPDHKVRFFNKKTAHPSESIVHQKIVTTNEKKVPVHILHYGWESLEQIIAKKNQYSSWHAKQLFDQRIRINTFKPVINGSVAFIRCYFFKKGFLNGIDGLSISMIQAFFSYSKYAKLLKIQKKNTTKSNFLRDLFFFPIQRRLGDKRTCFICLSVVFLILIFYVTVIFN